MHKDRSEAADLINALVQRSEGWSSSVQVLVAPPYPFLADAVEHLRGTRIVVAAQNCHEAAQGAYTGEVSAGMLASIGVGACIVGHSERRQYFGETDAAVGRKIGALLTAGIMPIYCCGEVRHEREEGRHFEVVGRQMDEALKDLDAASLSRLVVAYEPVWAIGTGKTASPEQAQEVHALIRARVAAADAGVAAGLQILYGGSMKPNNAKELMAQADIDGGLIGGAALVAEEFLAICRAG